MSIVIITGATGFLGSTIAKALITGGHRVIALKRSFSDIYRLIDIQSELVFYDIEHLDYVRPFTEHGHIDAVIHTSTCYGRAGETSTQVYQRLSLPQANNVVTSSTLRTLFLPICKCCDVPVI